MARFPGEKPIPKAPPPPLGSKFDTGKPRWSLLPWRELRDVVRVLTMGAEKYSRDNWKHVENARERYTDAAFRHFTAWTTGERIDSESGVTHLAHAVCCLLFLMWFDNETAGPDDAAAGWKARCNRQNTEIPEYSYLCDKCGTVRKVATHHPDANFICENCGQVRRRIDPTREHYSNQIPSEYCGWGL